MNKRAFIFLILLICLMSGYVWEFFPHTMWIAPFDTTESALPLSWWAFIGFAQLKGVILSWALWYYGIPKDMKLLKLAAGVICIFLTMIPVNFILFYFPPLKEITFVVTTTIGIAIVFMITYGSSLCINGSGRF
jgi:hypothetical protein